MTGQICDIYSKKFYNSLETEHKGLKYTVFIKSTTKRLLFLQKRLCLGAEYSHYNIFHLSK